MEQYKKNNKTIAEAVAGDISKVLKDITGVVASLPQTLGSGNINSNQSEPVTITFADEDDEKDYFDEEYIKNKVLQVKNKVMQVKNKVSQVRKKVLHVKNKVLQVKNKCINLKRELNKIINDTK